MQKLLALAIEREFERNVGAGIEKEHVNEYLHISGIFRLTEPDAIKENYLKQSHIHMIFSKVQKVSETLEYWKKCKTAPIFPMRV